MKAKTGLLKVFLGVLICLSTLLLGTANAGGTFCSTPDSIEFTPDPSCPVPPAGHGPGLIGSTRVLLIFVKLHNEYVDVECADDSIDGWPFTDTSSALPPFAHRVVCPRLSQLTDPDSSTATPDTFEVYPYRGNASHFYYDQSGGKHLIYGEPYSRTVVLPMSAWSYDMADDSTLNGTGDRCVCLAVLEAVDAQEDFGQAKYHEDGDSLVDTEIIILVRDQNIKYLGYSHVGIHLPGDAGCYRTDDLGPDEKPVYIMAGTRGIFQEGPCFTRAVTTLLHEWGHAALGDAWAPGMGHPGKHMQNLDGFDIMDGNKSRELCQFSPPYRVAAGWDTLEVLTTNTRHREITTFVDRWQRGDLLALDLDTLGADCIEYFLVENRQPSSFWEDPIRHWGDAGDPSYLRPCHYGESRGGVAEQPPDSGVVIYHVRRGGTRFSGDIEVQAPVDTLLNGTFGRVHVESPDGLFRVRPNAEGEWRTLQDQYPRPRGVRGWTRLDVHANEGGGMGTWSASDFWDGTVGRSNSFAPYTNPGTGKYRVVLEFGGGHEHVVGCFQNDSSGVAVLNIEQDPIKGPPTVMVADIRVDAPWGRVTNGTRWAGVVRLLHDVTIAQGDTLRILPGTIVVVKPVTDTLRAGVDTTAVEITVHGTLIAEGTSEDPILFTTGYDSEALGTPAYAADSAAAEGQWTGIVVEDSGQVRLEHCDIGYATIGVSIKGAHACGEDSMWIRSCTIHDCESRGVYVYNGAVRVESCEVYNTASGIRVQSAIDDKDCVNPASPCTESYIRDCYVHDCSTEGIWVKSSIGVRIMRNTVTDNGVNGIVLKEAAVVVDSNDVRNNGTGVLGCQLKVEGPEGRTTWLVRNYFGGEEEASVFDGVSLNLSGTGPGDTVFAHENTFARINSTGLRLLQQDYLMQGDSRSEFTGGEGDTVCGSIKGNEFIDVGIVFDFQDAFNTKVENTAAIDFAMGIWTKDDNPFFGGVVDQDTLGRNYFRNTDDDSLVDPATAFVLTTDLLTDSLHVQFCHWNELSCADIYAYHADMFLEESQPLPNKILLTDCMEERPPRCFPWGYWGEGQQKRLGVDRDLAAQDSEPVNGDDGASLSIGYPNPTTGTVSFVVGSGAVGQETSLSIFDVRGRLVRTLRSAQAMDREWTATWDGRDDHGRIVASGVYFARLEAGAKGATKRVVLLR